MDDAIASFYDTLYSEEEPAAKPEPDAFMEELARGASGMSGEIDHQIAEKAENWKLDRMPLVDRNVLRLAIYEMSRKETPAAVVIDEALELARQFAGDESVSFINARAGRSASRAGGGRAQRIGMNILMVASEATPFAKTGGLADVMGGLPAALVARGERVAVVLPAYRENIYPTAPREAYKSLWIPLGSGYTVRITQAAERGVDFFFVNCPALFDRDGIYGHSRRFTSALRCPVDGGFGRGALSVPAAHHPLSRLAGRARAGLHARTFPRRSNLRRNQGSADHSQSWLSGHLSACYYWPRWA